MIKRIFILYLLLTSLSVADDTGEAIVSVLDVTTKKYMDSSEVWLGGGGEVASSGLSQEVHIASRFYYLKKYFTGFSLFVPLSRDEGSSSIYGGLDLGFKQFNSFLGRHNYSLLLGGGRFHGNGGIILEPTLSVVLKESNVFRFFWVLHNVGVNTSLSFRYFIPGDAPSTLHNSNALKLNLNLYLKRRNRDYYK